MPAYAALLAVALMEGVPLTVWDALWTATPHAPAAYRAAFLTLYYLEMATIDVDELPVVVIRPMFGALTIWAQYIVFFASGGESCPDGCGLSKRPTP